MSTIGREKVLEETLGEAVGCTRDRRKFGICILVPSNYIAISSVGEECSIATGVPNLLFNLTALPKYIPG